MKILFKNILFKNIKDNAIAIKVKLYKYGHTKMVINLVNKPANINFVQILTIICNITKFREDCFKYQKYCATWAILVYCACPRLFYIGNLYETVPRIVFYPDSCKYYTGLNCGWW